MISQQKKGLMVFSLERIDARHQYVSFLLVEDIFVLLSNKSNQNKNMKINNSVCFANRSYIEKNLGDLINVFSMSEYKLFSTTKIYNV